MSFVETRLLRCTSSDATNKASNSAYTIDLGNVANDVAGGIRGISVVSCGFGNCHPNLPDATTFTVEITGGLFSSVVIPAGQYSFVQLTDAIVAGIGELVSIGLNPLGTHTHITGGVDFVSITNETWKLLGFTDAQLGVAVGAEVTAVNVPALQGLQVAYVHSSILAASQHSIDGEGLLVSFMACCPVTVPFGGLQTHEPMQEGMPSIVYKTPHSVRSFNLTLRDGINGRVVNVGNTEFWVVFRLWI